MSEANYGMMPGALDQIMMKDKYILNPVFQIWMAPHKSFYPRGENIYTLMLFDGVTINSSIWLHKNLNKIIKKLAEFTIIQITSYDLEEVKYRTIMIINTVQVLTQLNHPVYLTLPKKVIEYRRMKSPVRSRAQNFLVKVRDIGFEGEADSTVPNTEVQTLHSDELGPASASSSAAVQPDDARNCDKKIAKSTATKPSTMLAAGTLFPISALRPDQSTRSSIKARVTQKSNICKFFNNRGPGRFFFFRLLDQSGEIKCTAFFKECDKFYNFVEVDQVYLFSKFIIKTANKDYTKDDYEITLRSDSEINLCTDDQASCIPQEKYNFIPLQGIKSISNAELVDVIGIVRMCGDECTFTAKSSGKQHTKREFGLMDQNNDLINVTLWGDEAKDFDGSGNPVVAIKGARVNEFLGKKYLSIQSSSKLLVDPDMAEAHTLQEWFKTIGKSISVSNSSGVGGVDIPFLTFEDVKTKRIGYQDMPNVFDVKATIKYVKPENACYESCPLDECKKKVIKQENGKFKCSKCDEEYSTFKYRLLANVHLVDGTGDQWVTAFNEEAERMFEISGSELGHLKECNYQAYTKKISAVGFKSYIFRIRMKQEIFNDKTRLKATALAVKPVDYNSYTKQLLDKIKELSNIPNTEI